MRWVFIIISFWLTFVLSLAGWWLYFGMNILEQTASTVNSPQLVKHQRMLFQEGTVLFLFLLFGGVALFYFSYRMYKEKSAKENFFASFTHDIKTALFRLQLQIEKLEPKVGEESIAPVLVQTRKIQLDLENGLDSTMGYKKQIYFEKIDLKSFLAELHTQWPEFSINLKGDNYHIMADKKAMHSILKNLLHNSSLHGEADQVYIELSGEGKNAKVMYRDNGKPFGDSLEHLGETPRHSTEGSGFGLFIIRYWVERMGGKIAFAKGKKGNLEIFLYLPGAVTS